VTRGTGRKPGRHPSWTLWGGTARDAAAGAAPRVSLTSAPELLDVFSGANEEPLNCRCNAHGAEPRGVSAGVAPYVAPGPSAPSAALATDSAPGHGQPRNLHAAIPLERKRGAHLRARRRFRVVVPRVLAAGRELSRDYGTHLGSPLFARSPRREPSISRVYQRVNGVGQHRSRPAAGAPESSR
jgi:hypothetical protein